jgi:serine/threonine protein phosphatase PrpC
MSGDILFNPRSRSVRWPGIAGACVRAGSISSRDRTGMGDCILMDLRKGFYAVSDSSNRCPTASRRFLRKLARGLEALPDPGRVFSLEEFAQFSRDAIDMSEQVLQTIPYTESCTFTGILVAETEGGTKGILFHTGDSLLFEVNRGTSEARTMTTSNFWMVGKSKQFYQVEEIEIAPEAVFILATDGVADLNAQDYDGKNESLVKLVSRYRVEEVPDRLVEAIDLQRSTTDDLVIVSVDPHRQRASETTILLGGTEDKEERRYRKRCREDFYEDRFVPIREQPSKRECSLVVR